MQVTESELREALAARDRLPAAQRVESVRPAFTQDTLRLASESRFAAAKYAGEFARSAVFLEKPLAVIASHAGNIDDSSTAPGNTWVKFIVEDGGLHDAGIDRVDSLTFWYFWWNETASTIRMIQITILPLPNPFTATLTWDCRPTSLCTSTGRTGSRPYRTCLISRLGSTSWMSACKRAGRLATPNRPCGLASCSTRSN
jgi:hypothetical protein